MLTLMTDLMPARGLNTPVVFSLVFYQEAKEVHIKNFSSTRIQITIILASSYFTKLVKFFCPTNLTL